MSVVVARASILRNWQDGSIMLEVRSKAPIGTLLEITDVPVRRNNYDPQLGPEYLDLRAWPTPHGVGVTFDDCDSEDDVLAVVDAIVSGLETAGIDARIGPVQGDKQPWPSGRNGGFSAAMTLVGDPDPDAPATPDEIPRTDRWWIQEASAVARVVEHAVRWCQVEGGGLWVTPDITPFKIPHDRAVPMLLRLLPSAPRCSIVAARDSGFVRRVAFGRNGYVIYEIGGTDQPAWRECVEDLTTVLTDLHRDIVWGFVQLRPSGVDGIGPRPSIVTHAALWEPHRDQVGGYGRIEDARRHSDFVLNAYGSQVLGPGHNLNAVSSGWDIQDLGDGRRLVSSKDPASWFAEIPSLRTLLDARASFGELVDPIWSPAGV